MEVPSQQSQPQPFGAAEDQGEQRPRDRHFRQLKHHAPDVMHDFAADLDELVPQRCPCAVFHTHRQCHSSSCPTAPSAVASPPQGTPILEQDLTQSEDIRRRVTPGQHFKLHANASEVAPELPIDFALRFGDRSLVARRALGTLPPCAGASHSMACFFNLTVDVKFNI